MSNRKNDIGSTLSPEIIEKYLNGELSHKEMHEVEKLMLNSDFDAEAMEGFEETGTSTMQGDLNLIRERLNKQVKPEQNTIPWLKIAASVALLAITTMVLFNTELFKSEQQLAKEEASPTSKANEGEGEGEAESQPVEDSLVALNQQEKMPEENKTSTPFSANKDKPIEQPVMDMASEPLAEAKEEQAVGLAGAEDDQDIAEEIDAIVYEELETEIPEEVIIDKAPASDIEDLQGKVAGVQVTENARAMSKAKKAETKEIEAESRMTLRGASSERTASRNIKGQITSSEDGTGLPGVNVMVKGTTTGTITDFEGNYTLNLPQGIDPTLVVSFIGLSPKEVDVSGKNIVNIELEPDIAQLSEVVVTAMDVEREQRSLSHSMQTIELDKDKDERADIVPASPDGGKSSFKDYLQANAKPIDGQDGKVVVEFVVTTAGKLDNFRIVKGQNETLNNEAIRLIKEGPKWSPALRNGIPDQDKVRVKVKF
ncbi:TonB family protein [Fulvivirga ulvae]|uniref:energy transducer TonB n=1 Tax=Fulvivirga ulvae TaxID=2904245 RepID=UPI001F30D682|nr:energy transducer TonB [Fulvivirga ulvae]UII34754.1 TonB family protein [Fulvivirga ulvae]